MSRVNYKKMAERNGFTLIELLVVLTIIALLGAVVGPQVMKQLSGAKSKTARMQIEDFSAGLDLFSLENGRYPETQEGLKALIEAPPGLENWHGPYLKKKKIPQDPWNHDYHYKSPGDNGPYDLYSYGADNAPGGDNDDADILSWE